MRFKTAIIHILFLLALLTAVEANVTFEDITKDDLARVEFITNNSDSGLRIHIGDIKDGNKYVGTGSVNVGIDTFQNDMIKQMDEVFKKNKSITSIVVRKTDFKGYYITCKPMPNCLEIVSTHTKKNIKKMIPIENIKDKKTGKLKVKITQNKTYTKAYMQARFLGIFQDFTEETEMDEFIKNKASEVQELFAQKKINQYKLKELLGLYRREGLDKIEDINYKKAIMLLDALEVPFATASNLEESLYSIASSMTGKKTLRNGITLSKAFSGDDLFIIVKDAAGNNIDLIGADARGLGITNMITRFEELISPGAKIDSMDDAIELSHKAIKKADKQMFKSMDSYINLMGQKIENGLRKIDMKSISTEELQSKLLSILKKANQEYNQIASMSPNLMHMRAARIDPQNIKTIDNVREIMDLITEMHNEAKRLERSDIIKLITVDDLMDYKLQSLRLINCLRNIESNMQLQ